MISPCNMTIREKIRAGIDLDRNTGRTTRMVKDAVYAKASGRSVTIIVSSDSFREILRHDHPPIRLLEIPVFLMTDNIVDWDGPQAYIRGQKFDLICVDHHVTWLQSQL